MSELLGTYWWLILVALLIGIIVAWWVFAGRRTHVETARKPDVLDEGAAPAQRNQALIDAPSAATAATTAPIAPQAPPPPAPVATPEVIPAPITPPDVVPAPAPIPAAAGAPDDLSRIKGLGPKLKALLETLGITRFDQIAGWSEADIDRIDAQLGTFQGRIRRDSWVDQAKLLAAGDTDGFAGKFGNV